MSVSATYPVHVDARLDAPISRWLWLVKWVLVVPHLVVLFFLWTAFVVVSVAAFLAIVFTGRYPRSLFEFNVGVLRWTWRVAYYSYSALGTDRYPPFRLAEVPDYPTHLSVDYPERLSRGLVLVKWWLLALPHYFVVAVFAGGGAWVGWEADHGAAWQGPSGGLIGLLVVVAAVVLAFTGAYPRQIFDLVLGLNRWVLRVAAYAALMTDAYPPFRLDMGGHEASGTLTVPPPGGPQPAPPGDAASGPPAVQRRPRRAGWTASRVVSLVAGSLVSVVAVGLLAAGGAATWLDNTQRGASGYLTSDVKTYTTSAYAITSDRIDLGSSLVVAPSSLLGTIRFHVTPITPERAVFVGIAPRASADAYLSGVGRTVVTSWTGATENREQAGGPPASAPAASGIWVASVSGTGPQTLTWTPASGEWLVVVMNADAAAGVAVTADAGATVPSLGWIAAGLLIGGGVILLAGSLLVIVPVVRAGRRPPADTGSTP